MDADRAIAIIESLLAPKSLNPIQLEIVRGVIARNSYQQIVTLAKVDPLAPSQAGAAELTAICDSAENVETRKYKINYIKGTAAQLWQSLSQRLGRRVTKNSLAAVLLWYTRLPETTTGELGHSQPISLEKNQGVSPSGIHPSAEGSFYGRTQEIATLTDWCLRERCRLILLIGMGGMGKTRLAWELASRFGGDGKQKDNRPFNRTIWRSLVNAPSIEELCTDLLQCLYSPSLQDLPDSVQAQIALLIACLKQDRCLLIFDNVEPILAGQVQCGQYRSGYDGYDQLFRAISELPHQSCAILTSREKPHTIARLEIINPQSVRSMEIGGMTAASAHKLVQAHGCPQLPDWMWQEVHTHYDGNPLALKVATITAVAMTGGDEQAMLGLYPLMKQGKLQFQNIDDILARQFDRLSEIEQQLVYWLAIAREPVTGAELRANLAINPQAPSKIINALQSLCRRCITVSTNSARDRLHQRKWSIQPVMTAYVTRRLIDRFVTELSPDFLPNCPITDPQDRFFYLNTYAIIQPKTKDCIRQVQQQLILQPTLERLLSSWENSVNLTEHLQHLSSQWQKLDPLPAGYLLENVLSLLIKLNLLAGK
jgi:hypothetical protein